MIVEIIHITDYYFRYCCKLQQLGERGAGGRGGLILGSMLGKVQYMGTRLQPNLKPFFFEVIIHKVALLN